ncbi:MAG: hypothetical protein QNK05_08890 [Myxococcota bacterium]|nr:hypothetical protein [Myxococcota bacterium]
MSDHPVAAPRSIVSWIAAWIAAGSLIFVLLVAYPLGAGIAGDALGTRGLALALVALSLLTLLLPRFEGLTPGRWVRALLLLPLLAAAIDGDPRYLRAAPAFVHAFVSWLFARSLRDEDSLIERGARIIEPHAPPFIRPYCRKVTALWAGLEGVHAAVILALALLAPLEWWSAFAGGGVWISMAVMATGEYFVRKSWFRYYIPENPLDRVWARLLPAQNTAAGRRSAAFSRQAREQGLRPRGLRGLFRPGAFARTDQT